MSNILLTLGDSWPEGGELGNGRRYGEILQDTMGFDQFYNYGSGGASDHNGEHLINVQTNQYIRPNFAHPNQLGHELIAEKLQGWIQSTQ
jgi:lysophospholipase L1-like esterase